MAFLKQGVELIGDDPVGKLSGDITNILISSHLESTPGTTQAQGTVSGYSSGGINPPHTNRINKFSFASDADATQSGFLSGPDYRAYVAGQSSAASGYTSGGSTPGAPTPVNKIDKFPFAADGNATDVGDLTQVRNSATGQSSTVSGYTTAGYVNPNWTLTIDKFAFASDGNATDVGDTTQGRSSSAGHSSAVSGYTSGGVPSAGPINTDVIQKFPFAADANATDVGDLTQSRKQAAGQNSGTSGYTSGGNTGPGTVIVNTIDKFPFAADGNATDVGDLTTLSSMRSSGTSSTASGYTSGGYQVPPGAAINTIEKFPFAADGNATDVGNLTSAVYSAAGQQV